MYDTGEETFKSKDFNEDSIQIDENNVEGAKGCGKRTRLFTGYAVQDVGRNKCHFCLAFCSVFVVVVSILVVNTII